MRPARARGLGSAGHSQLQARPGGARRHDQLQGAGQPGVDSTLNWASDTIIGFFRCADCNNSRGREQEHTRD